MELKFLCGLLLVTKYIVTLASAALGIIFAYDGFGRPSREQQ